MREYHAEYYRPENLTVIIVGQIDIEQIAKAIAPLEQLILAKPTRLPFVKPWQNAVPPLTKSEDLKILYPADEEDCGLVNCAWRGPQSTVDNLNLTACSVLLRYLSDTSVSPLQREFVETADPYASQISFNISENSESLLYLTFENLPTDKIDLVFPKLKKILQNIAEGTIKDIID